MICSSDDRNGDITLLNAHAIVCCNNESLSDNDPVTAGTLLRAGPELKREMLNEIKSTLILLVSFFFVSVYLYKSFIKCERATKRLQEEPEFIRVSDLDILAKFAQDSLTKTGIH